MTEPTTLRAPAPARGSQLLSPAGAPRTAPIGAPPAGSLVSVVINFFNAEKFLEQAITSVFVQSYENWELLLVDDGSTDGSSEIARHYAAEHPARVRYLEHAGHRNRGTSASRNVGMQQAQGEYVAFLDADDLWLPTKLEDQLRIMEMQPEVVMVYGPARWWWGWTGAPEDSDRDILQDLRVQSNALFTPPALLPILLRHEDATPSPSGILLRRKLVETIGGFEESFPGMYDDQSFYAKIFLQAPVFVANECWYKYRQHAGSLCSVSVTTGTYRSARLSFLTWLAAYLEQSGVRDDEIRRTLRREIWACRYPILPRLLARVRRWIRNARA